MVPQLDTSFYTSQLFWLVLCFGFLVFAFKKYFIPRMDKLLDKRNGYINRYKKEIEKLMNDIKEIEKELKYVKEQEIAEVSGIIKKAIKKSDSLLSEQLKIIKKENDDLIDAVRSRVKNEIKAIDSIFRSQIDITSQIILDKLFSQRI